MTDNVKDNEEMEKSEVEEISDEELDSIAGGHVQIPGTVCGGHRIIDAHKNDARVIDVEF